MTPPETTVDALLERYDVFLLDAYGVLVHMGGALPGASELLAQIRRRNKKLLLLSNDASRLPSTTVKRYGAFGLELDQEDVLTSGMLLRPYFEQEGLVDEPTIVMGTEDSLHYARDAGARVVGFEDESASVVVVGDDDGYPFLRGIEQVLTTIFRRLDRDEPVRLVLPNPDLIYPRGEHAYGLASGSVALVLERGLRVRYAEQAPTFRGLGKPHGPMFEAAFRKLGDPDPARVVMLGDQLYTDVLGARDFRIDSVLVGTGLTQLGPHLDGAAVRPTWVLPRLRP